MLLRTERGKTPLEAASLHKGTRNRAPQRADKFAGKTYQRGNPYLAEIGRKSLKSKLAFSCLTPEQLSCIDVSMKHFFLGDALLASAITVVAAEDQGLPTLFVAPLDGDTSRSWHGNPPWAKAWPKC